MAMSSSHHLFFLEDTTAHPRTKASPLRFSPAVRTQACRNLLRVETKGEWNQSSRSSAEVVATATPCCWVRILHWPPVAFPSVFLFFSTATVCICRLVLLGWGIACRTFEIVVSHPLHKSIACPYPKEVWLVCIQKKIQGSCSCWQIYIFWCFTDHKNSYCW